MSAFVPTEIAGMLMMENAEAERQRDQARDIAVALEQENAELRRLLGVLLDPNTWSDESEAREQARAILEVM